MGCIIGKKRFVVNSIIEGQDENALEIISMLGFTPADIDLLYTAFWDIDADGSGLIRPEELFAYFEVEGTPFEEKIFALFDEDGSGVINFLEFVCTLWNILTLPQSDFGSVAYLLRDPTGKNTITFSDVRIILEMMHNKKIDQDPSLKEVFQQMKRQLESKISIYDFTKWASNNQSVVAPLVMLQLHLRLQIIGEGFWIRLTNLRKEHVEQGRLDYVKQLQEYVTEKNRLFREKLAAEEQERRRLSRIGKDVDRFNARDNIARKESRLLSFFQLHPKKKLARVGAQRTNEDHIAKAKDEGEAKQIQYLPDETDHLFPPLPKSRGVSVDNADSTVNNNDASNNKIHASAKNKPIVIKYEAEEKPIPSTPMIKTPNQTPEIANGKHHHHHHHHHHSNNHNNNHAHTSHKHEGSEMVAGSSSKNTDETLEGKISSKPSEKNNKHHDSSSKNKKKEYQELVSQNLRKKSSIFDIFGDNTKHNYDVLDEEEEHLAKKKKKVVIRKRRSIIKKPNLVHKE